MNAPRIAKPAKAAAPVADQAAFLRLFWHATRKVIVPRTTAEIGARLGVHDPVAVVRQAVSDGLLPSKNPFPASNPDAIWELTVEGCERLFDLIEAQTGADVRLLVKAAAVAPRPQPNRPHARSVVIRGQRFGSHKEAAAHFNLSERTVHSMIKLGRTDSIGLGRGGLNNNRRASSVVICGRRFESINRLAKYIGRSPTTVAQMLREGKTEKLTALINDADANAEAEGGAQ